MINRKEFAGIDLFLRQLLRNYEVMESESLSKKLKALKEAYEKAKFPNIPDFGKVQAVENRIRASRSVFAFAS
jgi:hypothetical protein